jgi:hypothetical protein
MADAKPAHQHRQQRLAACAGKLADREPDDRARVVPAWDDWRRWELRAAQAVASSALALYKPVAARFAERSCAAQVEPELWTSAQLERSVRLLKSPGLLVPMELVVVLDAPVEQRLAKM